MIQPQNARVADYCVGRPGIRFTAEQAALALGAPLAGVADTLDRLVENGVNGALTASDGGYVFTDDPSAGIAAKLTEGALVRIPGSGGHTKPARRPYGLLLIQDANVSRATGTVSLIGEARSVNGTTTRRKRQIRTTVQRPGDLTLIAEAPAPAAPDVMFQLGYNLQTAWLAGKTLDEAHASLHARLATASDLPYNRGGTRATADYIARLRYRSYPAERVIFAGEDFRCVPDCPNTPEGEGFATCLADGTEIEPDALWDGKLYLCRRCGRIINQDTQQVTGRVTSQADDRE